MRKTNTLEHFFDMRAENSLFPSSLAFCSRSLQVRLQLGATGGPFSVASGIIKQDGFGALYTVSQIPLT